MSVKSKVQTFIKGITRREVLKGLLNFAWVVPLSASLFELLKFFRFEPPITQISVFTLGTPDSLPKLPAHFDDAQIWLQKDERGYYAVDSICTHLGCTIEAQKEGGYYCRCHGSRFAADGNVLIGPASVPLHFVRLSWSDDGQIVVDRTEQIDKNTRLPAS